MIRRSHEILSRKGVGSFHLRRSLYSGGTVVRLLFGLLPSREAWCSVLFVLVQRGRGCKMQCNIYVKRMRAFVEVRVRAGLRSVALPSQSDHSIDLCSGFACRCAGTPSLRRKSRVHACHLTVLLIKIALFEMQEVAFGADFPKIACDQIGSIARSCRVLKSLTTTPVQSKFTESSTNSLMSHNLPNRTQPILHTSMILLGIDVLKITADF